MPRRRVRIATILVVTAILIVVGLIHWLHEMAPTRWPALAAAWSPSAHHALRGHLALLVANRGGATSEELALLSKRFSPRTLERLVDPKRSISPSAILRHDGSERRDDLIGSVSYPVRALATPNGPAKIVLTTPCHFWAEVHCSAFAM